MFFLFFFLIFIGYTLITTTVIHEWVMNKLFVNTDARSVLQNEMPNSISHHTQRSFTTCSVYGAGEVFSHLSGTGLPLFGSRRSIRQVQISSVTARVKDAPLSPGAGQGWAETAGCHMTKKVETFREVVLTNGLDPSWVRGCFGAPVISQANLTVSINRFTRLLKTRERD